MRNERSYNSSLGPTRVGAIQTPVSVPQKPARVNRPGPVTARVTPVRSTHYTGIRLS